MRTVAILSGGDWFDAAVNHISVPDDMSLEDKHTEYLAWRRMEPQVRGTYQSFYDWILEHGASDTDVEEFEIL